MPLFTHGPHDGRRWPDGTRLAAATLDYPGWAWTVEVLGWEVEIAGSNIGEAIAGAEAACAAVAGEPVRLNVGQTEDAVAYMTPGALVYGRTVDVGRGVRLTPHEAECLGVR